MADHELDAVVDHLVGDGHGLLGIAGVVIDDGFDLLALDAARLVDLLDRHLATGELHVTVLGDRAGQGAGDADLDGIGRIGHGD